MPQKFEDMFSKWDEQQRGSLSAGQLFSMIKGHRMAVDPFGVCILSHLGAPQHSSNVFAVVRGTL